MLAKFNDVSPDRLFEWVDEGTMGDRALDGRCEEIADAPEIIALFLF